MICTTQNSRVNHWGFWFLSFLTLLFVPHLTLAACPTPDIYVSAVSGPGSSTVSAAAGGTVIVHIMGDICAPTPNSFGFTVAFDKNLLTVATVTQGTGVPSSGTTFSFNADPTEVTPGTVIIGAFSSGTMTGTNQDLADITFTVNSTPPSDTCTNTTGTCSNITPSGVTFGAVNVTSISTGTFALNISEGLTATTSPGGEGTITCGDTSTTCPTSVNSGTSEEFFGNPGGGFALSGWTVTGSSAGGDCGGATGTCTVTITGTTTVTANFTSTTRTVAVSAAPSSSDGTVTCGDTTTTCTSPVNVNTSVEFFGNANPGFELSGWTVTGSAAGAGCGTTGGTCTVDITLNTNVTANFIPIPESITATPSPSEDGTVTCGNSTTTCASTVNENSTVVFFANPNPGFALDNATPWTVTGSAAGSGCAGTSGTCSVDVTTGTTVTANFVAVPETLTAQASPALDGNVTCGDSSTACTTPVNGGSSIEFFADPGSGFELSGTTPWTVTGSTAGAGCTGTSGTCTVLITATTVVTANFIPIPESISAAAAPSGDGTVTCGNSSTPCASSVNKNASVEFFANPNPGFALSSWTVSGSAAGAGCNTTGGTCTVSITASTTVTANFASIPETLTAAAAPSSADGSVTCGNSSTACTTPVNGGNSIQFFANPNVGFVLSSWTVTGSTPGAGCSDTSGTCTVDITATTTVTANFVPAPVAGACGTAAQTYGYGTSSFGSNTICSVGSSTPGTVTFPAAGKSITWSCSGLNGGASANCSASQKPKIVIRF